MPADGATGVATNSELGVLYFGTLEGYAEEDACDVGSLPLRLVPADGEPVELQPERLARPEAASTWWIARPEGGLLPDTDYALQAPFGEDGGSCGCSGPV